MCDERYSLRIFDQVVSGHSNQYFKMAHDIPLPTQWSIPSYRDEGYVSGICEQWFQSPSHPNLTPSENYYLKQLKKSDKSQIIDKAKSMLEKCNLSDFKEIRRQILDMLLLWEWAIREKNRYDNGIRPFSDGEIEEGIGAKNLLACVHILHARATIEHERRTVPPSRDDGLVQGIDSISESEDEIPEPLESWKSFSKPVDMIASVVGSSKKVVNNRPPKRKYPSDDDSDAYEHTRKKKVQNTKKKVKKEDQHPEDDSDTSEHGREKKAQNTKKMIKKEDSVNENKRKKKTNDNTSDIDSENRKDKKGDSVHEKKRKANDDIGQHKSKKNKRNGRRP